MTPRCLNGGGVRIRSTPGQRRRRAIKVARQSVLFAAACTILASHGWAADEKKSNLILGNLPPSQSGAIGGGGLNGGDATRVAQVIAGFSVKDASGAPGTAIPLQISLPTSKTDDYTFVMIRGLAKNIKLSAGFQTKDAWAVSLRDVQGLTLTAPPGLSGVTEIEVLLVKGRDVTPESRRMTLTIGAAGRTAPAQADATASTSPPEADTASSQILAAARSAPAQDALGLKDDQEEEKTGLVTAPTGITAAEESALMARASIQLKSADVSAARLLFEHLARRGSAKGAFAMGQTYDPEFLKTLFVKGLKADVEKARIWYRKSIELGGGEARASLSALDAAR